MPITTEPRAALRGTDLRCCDHFTRTVTGQLVGLDVAIHHPTRPGDMSFSTPRRRLGRWEAAKRRLYADLGWPDAPEVPRCVPLVASTFGEIGPSARAFFASVIRGHLGAQAVTAGALQAPRLHAGRHTALWRRRLSVQLRAAIGTQQLARLHAGVVPLAITAARREGRALRCFETTRRVMARVTARCRVAAPLWAPADAVGFAFGGDVCRSGVVGDGFARGRPHAQCVRAG